MYQKTFPQTSDQFKTTFVGLKSFKFGSLNFPVRKILIQHWPLFLYRPIWQFLCWPNPQETRFENYISRLRFQQKVFNFQCRQFFSSQKEARGSDFLSQRAFDEWGKDPKRTLQMILHHQRDCFVEPLNQGRILQALTWAEFFLPCSPQWWCG